jgi:plastocyanin
VGEDKWDGGQMGTMEAETMLKTVAEPAFQPGPAVRQGRVARLRPLRLLVVIGVLGIAAVLGLGTWLLAGQRAAAPLREVRLVAQDGRFDTPVLEVRSGERVRLTIVNQERDAISHDFAIAALGVRSPLIEPGREVTITFTAKQPGSYVFGCTVHPRLMDGKLSVSR